MKFDFCIGNPPYQEESQNKSDTNGQAPRKNVFHYFQMQADMIANEGSVMVYPGARWMHQSGKGLKQFGYDQINDKHLSRLEYYPDSSDLFKNTSISDGISIVCKKMKKNTSEFQYGYNKNGIRDSVIMKSPGNNIIPLNPKDFSIAEKIEKYVNNLGIVFLHDYILPRSLFNIESDFVEKNPGLVKEYTNEMPFDTSKEIKLFTNDKAGAAGRSSWFICQKDLIKSNSEYIDQWQVVVSSAHPGGQEGRDNQLSIVDNHSAFGRARVALASFKSEEEAKNFYKYCKSIIIQYAFLMTDEALTSLGKKVPHYKSYSNNNGYLNFDKDIDKQLVLQIGFTNDEFNYITETVRNNGPKGGEN